jgi:hypothetical protein
MYQPHSPQHAAPRTRPLWPWFAGLAAALFIAGAFTFAFWVTSDDNGSTGRPSPLAGTIDPDTALREAFSSCHSGDLADGDHTLVIDTEGEEYGTGTDTFDGLTCTLGELDTPQSIIARMERTRALDGMQTAQWGDFEASWTFHPDDGVDLILTETETE